MKNIKKGAKNTTDSTKYICVSQYGTNANEISAYSVIVKDAKNDHFIDGEVLLLENYASSFEFMADLDETIAKCAMNYNCRVLIDYSIHPVNIDKNGMFLWIAFNANYYKKAIEEEALRNRDKRFLGKVITVQNLSSFNNKNVVLKVNKNVMLNLLLDEKYPHAKSLIN